MKRVVQTRNLVVAMMSVALTSLGACATISAGSSSPSLATWMGSGNPDVLVVSHRGCWKLASENSLDGIEACISAGIDMVEFDTRTTADGAVVLMHDETVDRTTDGHGAVADLTLAQIRALHLRRGGGGAAAPLTDRRVPTLEEALATTHGRILVNVDNKAVDPARLVTILRDGGVLDEALVNTVPTTLLPSEADKALAGSVFQPVLIERLKAGPVSETITGFAPLRPSAYQLIFTSPAYFDEALAAVKPTGARVFVNTMAYDIARGTPMNLAGDYLDTRAVTAPDAVWGTLADQGVTLIQTDLPLELLAYLRATGRHSR